MEEFPELSETAQRSPGKRVGETGRADERRAHRRGGRSVRERGHLAGGTHPRPDCLHLPLPARERLSRVPRPTLLLPGRHQDSGAHEGLHLAQRGVRHGGPAGHLPRDGHHARR